MKQSKIRIFVLTFFLLLVSVSAIPPQTNPSGLQISYPPFTSGAYGSELEFPFLVYDLATGLAVNTGVNCTINLYNSSGENILIVSTSTPFNNYDYKFIIGANNFSENGHYAFNTYCFTTDKGGFVRADFYITKNGDDPDRNGNAIPLLLSVFIVVWLAIKLMFNLDKDHLLLKLFFSIIAVLFTYGGLAIALNIAISSVMSVSVIKGMTIVYTAFTWVLYLFFTYLVVYYIYRLFKYQSEDKYN